MCSSPIDLWDQSTFDSDLAAFLESARPELHAYYEEEEKISASSANAPRWSPRPPNMLEDRRKELHCELSELLSRRAIRAFHYSRLTDDEVAWIIDKGFEPSTPALLQRRLDARVEAGDLAPAEAEIIFARSPLHSIAYGDRNDLFWVVSAPLAADDDGVECLLKYWGGESAYWCLHENPQTLKRLTEIGESRVIELAVDLVRANDGGGALHVADTIIETIAKQMRVRRCCRPLDLWFHHAISADQVLRVHSAGEGNFKCLGRED